MESGKQKGRKMGFCRNRIEFGTQEARKMDFENETE
jgi:hypothetical protein